MGLAFLNLQRDGLTILMWHAEEYFDKVLYFCVEVMDSYVR